MSLEKTVIENIKRIRKEEGISQERLAAYSNTSTSYIGLMETYRNIPKLSTIEKIAEGLDVPPITLFEEHNDEKSNSNIKKPTKTELAEQLKKNILADVNSQIDDFLDKI